MISDRIRDKIGNSWEGKTPGFHLQVIFRGETVANERFGVTYPIYDWASLTKIVFTHTLLMSCIDEERLHENDLVGKFLPELKSNNDLKIKHLLSHSAGLPGTINFWSKKPLNKSEVYQEWRKQVLDLEMAPSPRSSYTEIDYQIIGYILESILGPNLEDHWQVLSKKLGLFRTAFRPQGKSQCGSRLIAPTEICPLRGVRIQGEVHHPDVWLNGGVGWLAGLFGPIDDLAVWVKGACPRTHNLV